MVRMDDMCYNGIMGRRELVERNESGEGLVDLCGPNKVVIGISILSSKCTHIAALVSSDFPIENWVVPICIDKKFRRSMQRSIQREDNNVSDHHLVTVVKLILKARSIRQPGKQYQKGLMQPTLDMLKSSVNPIRLLSTTQNSDKI